MEKKKDNTPTDKIAAKVAALDQASLQDKKLFVLVSTGSLNPVHRYTVSALFKINAILE
jgi:hypothetical protein